MAIVIKRPGGIKLLLQAANAPAYPAPTTDPLNTDLYFQYKDDTSLPQYLGTFPVGQEVQVPFAVDYDRDVIVFARSRGPLGQQFAPDIRDVTPTLLESEREQRQPIIGQMGASTWLKAIIGISYFPRHMRARRILIATDAAFTNIIQDWYEDIDRTELETPYMPVQFSIHRTTPTSGVMTYYIKVAHAAFSTAIAPEPTYQGKLEGLRWGPDSDVLEVKLADNNGTGGSSGNFNPFTATFQGYGTTGDIYFSVPMPGDSTGLTGTNNGFDERLAIWDGADNLSYAVPIYADRSAGRILTNGYTLPGSVSLLGGSGSPQGAATAEPGSRYFRADKTEWLKLSGSGNTGWQDITNARAYAINVKGDPGLTAWAVGDGTTNDTAAIQSAITLAAAGGRAIYLPAGRYKVDTLTGWTDSMHIFGDGSRTSILVARGDGVPVIEVTGGAAHSMLFEAFGVEGFGKTSDADGHGIYVHDTGGLAFQIAIRNVEVRECGGRGIFLLENFSCLIDNVSVSHCGDNAIEGEFDNSCTLVNCYVHDVADGKAGYRIYSGGTNFIGCNGIDSGANTWWAVLGKSLAGGDDADAYCRAQFIGCNVEDSRYGIWCKAGSYITSIEGTSFFAPTTITGCIAIKLDFVDENTIGVMGSGCRFALKFDATWLNSQPIRANTVPFIMHGNRVSGGQYWDTSLSGGSGLAVDLPYLSVTRNTTTNEGGVLVSNLAVGSLDSNVVPTITNFRDLGSSSFTFQNGYFGSAVILSSGAYVGGAFAKLTNGANPNLLLTGSSGASTIGRVQVLDASYMQIGMDTNHPIYFRTNNIDQLVIDQNGTLAPPVARDGLADLGYNGGRFKDLHLAGKIYWNTAQTVFDDFGAGSPEGVVTASPGARWCCTDGGASTTLYIKESGTGNTGWVAYGAPNPTGITGTLTAGRVTLSTGTGTVSDSGNLLFDNTNKILTVSGAGNNPHLLITDTTNAIDVRVGTLASAPDRGIIGTMTNDPFVFYQNGGEAWGIDASKNLIPYGASRSIGASGAAVTDIHIAGNAVFYERTAPSTPSANSLVVYAKDKSGTSALYYKNDAGTELELGVAGGSGTVNSGASGSLAYYPSTGTTVDDLSTGSGITTWLTTPSSANLLAALTTKTGTGLAVFDTAPTFNTSITMASGATTVGGQYWQITGGNNPEYKLNDTGGGGNVEARFKLAQNDRARIIVVSNHDFTIGANNTDHWRFKAAGHLIPETSLAVSLGDSTHFVQDVFIGRRLVGGGSAPSSSTGTGAGTSPSISVDGTQLGCYVTLTTGSSPATNAKIFDLTLAAAAPNYYLATLTPVNTAAKSLSGNQQVYINDGVTTSTKVFVYSGSSALAGSTTYDWYLTFIAI